MQDAQPGPGDNPPATHEAGPAAAAPVPFVVTKEHRRFAEFADAVRRDRYIGLCYGPPGVGKTLSARQYAGWDIAEPYLQAFRPLDVVPVPQQAMTSRTIVYTPKVCNSPRLVDKEITFLHERLSWGIEWELQRPKDFAALSKSCGPRAELLILAFVLARHWPELRLDDTADFTTREAVAAITRITSGNFRLTGRLIAQIQRILDINHLSVVTSQVVEAARESLVIGVM